MITAGRVYSLSLLRQLRDGLGREQPDQSTSIWSDQTRSDHATSAESKGGNVTANRSSMPKSSVKRENRPNYGPSGWLENRAEPMANRDARGPRSVRG
ncbi:hypothetical protein PUN28_016546 [Cardiocondyla obscurior]|uniref:Uncharacterized protein n=1 Tax=Cardiocondyla obscurior TaxID=286306 RepID=A0AAW2EQA8_9HYME